MLRKRDGSPQGPVPQRIGFYSLRNRPYGGATALFHAYRGDRNGSAPAAKVRGTRSTGAVLAGTAGRIRYNLQRNATLLSAELACGFISWPHHKCGQPYGRRSLGRAAERRASGRRHRPDRDAGTSRLVTVAFDAHSASCQRTTMASR